MAKKTTDDTEITDETKKKVTAKKAAVKKTAPKKASPKKEAAAKKAPAKKAATKKASKTDTAKADPAKDSKKDTPAKDVEKVEAPKGIIEHFKDETMAVEKETLPHCRVKFTITPAKNLWDKAKKQAVKKIAKDVSIPGFRKGKAPANIILKKHATQVAQTTESELADICFKECQKMAKVPILHGHNNVSFHIEGEGEEKKLFFAFESEPAVPEIDFSNFNLKAAESEDIDEKRLQEEIDQVRSFYATWEQIEDRPVELGDFVVLNIDDMDQDPPSRVFNDARFEVKEDKMAEWMRAMVIGAKKDDSIEGISKPDTSASDEDKDNFKEKKVRISITTIEKSTMPEVNEELAKKVGTKDVAEMKDRLKSLVKSKADRLQREERRADIEKQMIDKVLFDIPATLLEKEANHRVTQLFSNVKFKKQWETEFTEEQKDQKKEEIKEKATQAIRLFYLCRDIVGKNKISVGDEDMKSDFSNVLDMMYADQSKLQYQSMSDEQKQMALTQVMMHKAEDHIIDALENK